MAATRLSERAILDAAVELSRTEGVKGLTMRALAGALGVSPMATYHYVRSRDELLLLVADEVMRPVQPPPPGGSWDERLWTFMLAMGDALASVPGLVVDVLLPNDITPESRRYMQQCIELIRDGGFAPAAARRAFLAVYTFMWGSAVFQAVGDGRAPVGPRRRVDAVPRVDELTSRRNLEVGYRALVAGLELTLRPA
jgi:AcrR family transcriptional regulator